MRLWLPARVAIPTPLRRGHAGCLGAAARRVLGYVSQAKIPAGGCLATHGCCRCWPIRSPATPPNAPRPALTQNDGGGPEWLCRTSCTWRTSKLLGRCQTPSHDTVFLGPSVGSAYPATRCAGESCNGADRAGTAAPPARFGLEVLTAAKRGLAASVVIPSPLRLRTPVCQLECGGGNQQNQDWQDRRSPSRQGPGARAVSTQPECRCATARVFVGWASS